MICSESPPPPQVPDGIFKLGSPDSKLRVSPILSGCPAIMGLAQSSPGRLSKRVPTTVPLEAICSLSYCSLLGTLDFLTSTTERGHQGQDELPDLGKPTFLNRKKTRQPQNPPTPPECTVPS